MTELGRARAAKERALAHADQFIPLEALSLVLWHGSENDG
jgi:hypothetical protein